MSDTIHKKGRSLGRGMNRYRCKHCREILIRKSSKQWIKSYCDKTSRFVHLMLIPKGKKTRGA